MLLTRPCSARSPRPPPPRSSSGAWVGDGDSLGPRHLVHVLCGGGCLVGVALAVYRCEPELAAQLRALRRKKSV